MDHSIVSSVGDVEVRVVGGDGHGDGLTAARGDGRLHRAQRAGLGVRRVGFDLPGAAGRCAGGIGHEDIVDGDELAGSQESGHQQGRSVQRPEKAGSIC